MKLLVLCVEMLAGPAMEKEERDNFSPTSSRQRRRRLTLAGFVLRARNFQSLEMHNCALERNSTGPERPRWRTNAMKTRPDEQKALSCRF
jgi:hypothetical protein